MIVIGNLNFKSKASAKRYIRELLKKHCPTKSVKSLDPSLYNFLYNLCLLHSKHEVKKIHQSIDFLLKFDCSKRGVEINNITKNNEIISFVLNVMSCLMI